MTHVIHLEESIDNKRAECISRSTSLQYQLPVACQSYPIERGRLTEQKWQTLPCQDPDQTIPNQPLHLHGVFLANHVSDHHELVTRIIPRNRSMTLI